MFSLNYQSPIGPLEVVCGEEALLLLHFAKSKKGSFTKSSKLCEKVVRQLDLYFQGQLVDFDLPFKVEGTLFQKKVWNALCQIPYGETCSYKHIAMKIKNPKSCRAVGGANNKNPIPIIIPCHRVIGKSGELTGYGGGLSKKKKLLALEKAFSSKIL